MKFLHSTQIRIPHWLSALAPACADAGAMMLRYREADAQIAVQRKADGSPVCVADVEAGEQLAAALKAFSPEVELVSEEWLRPVSGSTFWLLDPLDGTREYLAGRDAFSVNIALVECGEVSRGLIYYPVSGQCWWAERGAGAWCNDRRLNVVQVADRPDARLLVSGREPSSSVECWSRGLRSIGWRGEVGWQAGAAKLCSVAAGEAVLHARVSAACAWDIAAGQILIEEAGGVFVSADGRPVRYLVNAGAGSDTGQDAGWAAPSYFAGSREAVEACLGCAVV